MIVTPVLQWLSDLTCLITRELRSHRTLLLAAALVAATTTSTAALAGSSPMRETGRTAVNGIRVVGNRLVDSADRPIQLIGLNRAGTEYACAQGWGIFDGPTGVAVIRAMRSWSINAVRVPLNEGCWLGVNVSPLHSGATYRSAIENYVKQLSTQGLTVILDLHWSAPGTSPAVGQQQMPDADHSIAFWRSVAKTFRSNANIAFELYNEPHSVSWKCWKEGCVTSGGWRAVGMQSLINAVRGTGASEPIIIDGLDWANNLSGWMTHPLRDPLHQLAAGFHTYPWTKCITVACWNKSVATVAKSVPVITTEVGENDCKANFVTSFLNWATPRHISALVWTWNDNEGCLSLLRGPDSGATAYGSAVLRDFEHLNK